MYKTLFSAINNSLQKFRKVLFWGPDLTW